MVYLGYLGALLVGLTLGLMGAGGSIIAVPAVHYFFGIDMVDATTYAFFIVGITALIGAERNIRKGYVSPVPALYFALPSVAAVYLVRTVIIPAIPETLFSIGHFTFTKDLFILVFFAVLMSAAGISMLISPDRGDAAHREDAEKRPNFAYLAVLGGGVGLALGFAGVGGGFLITPALIMLARLPVKKAIGTSLCIISLNSFVGFFSSLKMVSHIDWGFIGLFVLLTIIGILVGNFWAGRIRSILLKRIFGWFVLMMGVYIIFSALYFRK